MNEISPDGQWQWNGTHWVAVANSVGSSASAETTSADISPDGQWRWNGSEWTPTDAATPKLPSTTPTASKESGNGKKIVLGVGAGIAALLIIGAVAGGGGTQTGTTSATSPGASQPTAPQAEKAEPMEEPAAAPPADSAPELTLAQENVLEAAEDYLDYQAFSRSGLIEQLEYEDYSAKDATWAVDQVNADWDEQAALAAKDYLEYDSFSRSGLIEQLKFEGYTTAQATFGAKAVGY